MHLFFLWIKDCFAVDQEHWVNLSLHCCCHGYWVIALHTPSHFMHPHSLYAMVSLLCRKGRTCGFHLLLHSTMALSAVRSLRCVEIKEAFCTPAFESISLCCCPGAEEQKHLTLDSPPPNVSTHTICISSDLSRQGRKCHLELKMAVTCILAQILVPILTSKVLKISAQLFHEKGT